MRENRSIFVIAVLAIIIYSVALLLLGGQFMSIGFVAELVIAYHDPDVKSYSISKETESTDQDANQEASDA